MQRGHRGRLIVVGVAAASVLAACGSAGSKTATTKTAPGAPLGQAGEAAVLTGAYSKTLAAKSAKMTLAVTVVAAGKTVKSTGSGAFSWSERLGQITQNVSTAGQQESVTEILDGSSLYVQLPAQAQAESGGKPWLRVDLSGLGSSGSSGSADPAQTLSVLEGASSGIQNLGSQPIDGVATTHYLAQVDLTKEAADAPAAAKKLLAQLPTLTGSSTLPVNVWVDAQGLPRQLAYDFTIKTPPAGLPAAAAKAFPETVKLTMGLSDYGTPVTVTVPPASEVSTQSLPGLSGS